MPLALQKLKRNISLNRMNEAITVQPVALGDKPGKAELYSFSGLPHLHSSLSRQGREDATGQEVTVMTLDDAIGSGVVPNPDIIKIDVEGYELQVLHGAIELLKNSTPIWLFEMNEETSAAFHYSPVDLLHHICSHAPYKFIRIPSAWGRAQPMHFARDYQHGDNVVCYIHEKHSERLRNVLRPFTVG